MGYDLELFTSRNQAEKYFCVVCQGVAKEIFETDCGHIFCRSCIGGLITATNDDDEKSETHCPHCRSVISWKTVHASKFADREVCNLQIICNQCNEWNGSLMKLNDHQSNECSHHWMECEWKLFGCQMKVKRKDMEEHNEKYIVNHLTSKVTHLTKKNKCWENTVQKLKRDMKSKEQKWKQKTLALHKKIAKLTGNKSRSSAVPLMKSRKRHHSSTSTNDMNLMDFKRRRLSSDNTNERSPNSSSYLSMMGSNYSPANDPRRKRGRSHQRLSEDGIIDSHLSHFSSPDLNFSAGDNDHEDSA